ncbi:hypothetical protein [Spongiactinospora sp. TRM90649]|uniref:hypothetical protein n=1 Tax=Spongiactinospora sp. TRM90649 TaxID=3031114 RepID=UPI0023F70DA6|nr:hypothetical protein [Spongiactinospora sp. TRM90649]MDF5753227.1 hypothetical protein [Spongiactinospora sp. TRM90649]
MTLLDMQRAFSRMLTDQTFQRGFMLGEPAALAAYDLSDAELSSLRGIDRDRLALQARLLADSRLELALGALPLTSLLLHHDLHDHVERFCGEFPPVPEANGAMIVEAERLCAFAVRLLREGTLTPGWAEDVVEYERIVLDLSTSPAAWEGAATVALLNEAAGPLSAGDLPGLVPVTSTNVRLATFSHDLAAIVPELEDGRVPERVERLARPQYLLFVKRPAAVLVRRLRVNAATAALIEAGDGVRTTEEVLADVARAVGAPALAPDARSAALATLLSLRELGAVGFRAPEGDPKEQ